MEIYTKFIIKIAQIFKLFSKRYGVIFFDCKNPPIEGDSITVSGMTAKFKPIFAEKEVKEINKNLDNLSKLVSGEKEIAVVDGCNKLGIPIIKNKKKRYFTAILFNKETEPLFKKNSRRNGQKNKQKF